MKFEDQHRLWTEYLATMLTLNALIDPTKVSLHPVMTFPEFIDSKEWHRYHEIKRYSFLDKRHYDFKELKLETEQEWYNRL